MYAYPQTGGFFFSGPVGVKFDKPAKSLDEQIDLLRERGMIVADPGMARHYLSHLNYYRLTGYWLPFEESHDPHRFRAGTRFEDALNLYVFDRELRLLLLDAIERIEVSIRTQWAFHIAHHAGPHAYLDPRHAASHRKHAKHSAILAHEVGASKEPFIAHYRKKYTDPDMPPAWSMCEVLSLGQLSHWYELLRPISLRSRIARTYQLDQQVLESFLHHLTYVRNLCAHHSRVWNRELTITAPIPRTKPGVLAAAVDKAGQGKIYNTCCYIQHLMNVIALEHHWHRRLSSLIDKHSIETISMGFPEDWASRPLWMAVANDAGAET